MALADPVEKETYAAELARCCRRALQRGQGMVEYALILSLVAVVVIAILITQGSTMWNLFSNISNTLHIQAGM
jgi:pilus assembly protein Flp/PilA